MRAGDRHRGWQHLPGPRRQRSRDGSCHQRLHGHARHGDQRARAAGRAREAGRADAGTVGHRDAAGGRALHPATRDPSPGKGARGHLRRGHRQSLLHDRHRREPARDGDRRPGDLQSDACRWGVRCRPGEAPGGDAVRRAHVHRRPQSRAPGNGFDGDLAVHGQRPADSRLQHAPARQYHAGRHGGPHRHAGPRGARMTDEVLGTCKEEMERTISAFKKELSHVRTGRANVALLDGIMVDYYGTKTPLNQVATLSVPEATLLVVQPYDKSVVAAIEKAIKASDLGLNPQSDGKLIRVPIPPLNEERRRELVKHTRKLAEDYRVSVRNHRRDALEMLKELEKDREITEDDRRHAAEKIETATKETVDRLEKLPKTKEDEIMAV